MIRLTWVQPEDLIGHELRQAAEDGRDAARIAARWRAAGGHDAPPRAGASEPAAARLRGLAEELLDELAAIPSPLAEPSDLPGIIAACPGWPAPPHAATSSAQAASSAAGTPRRRRSYTAWPLFSTTAATPRPAVRTSTDCYAHSLPGPAGQHNRDVDIRNVSLLTFSGQAWITPTMVTKGSSGKQAAHRRAAGWPRKRSVIRLSFVDNSNQVRVTARG